MQLYVTFLGSVDLQLVTPLTNIVSANRGFMLVQRRPVNSANFVWQPWVFARHVWKERVIRARKMYTTVYLMPT